MNEQEKYDWKVCVRCFTYNHANYIVDAMNGFTMQETSFPYICCIVDDASTDGEQEVIKNYLKEYFDLEDKNAARQEETYEYILTFARHKTNLNCFFAVLALKYNHYGTKQLKARKLEYISEWYDNSKYHALCEGDDYWTYPQKLQYQTNFMETHTEYGLTYGCVEIIDNNSKSTGHTFGGPSERFEELIVRSTIPTLTVMLRKELLDNYERDIKPVEQGWLMGDYPRWLYISHESKIKFMPIIMGVYRQLEESVSHSKSFEKTDSFIQSLFDMKSFFCNYYNFDYDLHDFKYRSLAHNAIKYGQQDKVKEYLNKIHKKNALIYLLIVLSRYKYWFKIASSLYRRVMQR